jgi:hypothetical protein
VRIWIVVVAALALAGCNSTSNVAGRQPPQPAERCAERMLAGIDDHRAQVRSYLRRTYCDRFAAQGWVYPDGKLSIKAHLSMLNGTTCSTSTSGGPTVTKTPCPVDPLDLECAMLHYVRKPEAQAYIRRLQRKGAVKCDDGTPLGDLGA